MFTSIIQVSFGVQQPELDLDMTLTCLCADSSILIPAKRFLAGGING